MNRRPFIYFWYRSSDKICYTFARGFIVICRRYIEAILFPPYHLQTHFLRGDTYLYLCSMADHVATWGSVQREYRLQKAR